MIQENEVPVDVPDSTDSALTKVKEDWSKEMPESPYVDGGYANRNKLDMLARVFLEMGDLEAALLRCGYSAQDKNHQRTRIKKVRSSWRFKLALERELERLYLKTLRDIMTGNLQASASKAVEEMYKFFLGRKPTWRVIESDKKDRPSATDVNTEKQEEW